VCDTAGESTTEHAFAVVLEVMGDGTKEPWKGELAEFCAQRDENYLASHLVFAAFVMDIVSVSYSSLLPCVPTVSCRGRRLAQLARNVCVDAVSKKNSNFPRHCPGPRRFRLVPCPSPNASSGRLFRNQLSHTAPAMAWQCVSLF
jgi:hypothetical protein